MRSVFGSDIARPVLVGNLTQQHSDMDLVRLTLRRLNHQREQFSCVRKPNSPDNAVVLVEVDPAGVDLFAFHTLSIGTICMTL